jgi:hypothetical protein
MYCKQHKYSTVITVIVVLDRVVIGSAVLIEIKV